MTTLEQKIIEIIEDKMLVESLGKDNKRVYVEFLANQILEEIHQNPSIKQGLKLLKEKREQDVWDRGVKNKLRGK